MKIAVLFLTIVAIIFPVSVYAQQSTVTAEALGQANLRASTTTDSDIVGGITTGTQYPVIGRSEFFPWLLLGDPATGTAIGWVFEDLVTLQGDKFSVPLSTQDILSQAPTGTAFDAQELFPTATLASGQVEPTPEASVQLATSTPIPFNVAGVILGEINIRYGPGTDYPRVGVANAGERYQIVAYHTQFPWVQLAFPDAPDGTGWVAQDLIEIQGDIFTLPAVSQTTFNLPTLTPTPSVIQESNVLADSAVPLSSEFVSLGERIWEDVILESGFDPQTSKFASMFVMNLDTGEAMSFGEDIAYSGISINKIAILATLYAKLPVPPTEDLAINIANTMICSDNFNTNSLLRWIGQGDEYRGAAEVTQFLRDLGLEKTFLTAPFALDPNNIPVPPTPIEYPQTPADQEKADTDPSNQLTVDEIGWLLGTIYQCGYQETGALLERFPEGTFEARECRQMLHVMSSNTVDALLKAGVPADTRTAHKHGWIESTHGNAAVFFTPGANYVIAIMTHQSPEVGRLNYQESLPMIAEASRQVYNFYNPQNLLPQIREGFIPPTENCNYTGSPLIADLMSIQWDQ